MPPSRSARSIASPTARCSRLQVRPLRRGLERLDHHAHASAARRAGRAPRSAPASQASPGRVPDREPPCARISCERCARRARRLALLALEADDRQAAAARSRARPDTARPSRPFRPPLPASASDIRVSASSESRATSGAEPSWASARSASHAGREVLEEDAVVERARAGRRGLAARALDHAERAL